MTAAARRRPFLTILWQEGAASEFDLVSALAEEYGMPGVDLGGSSFLLDVLDLVPRPVAEGDQILPLSTEGGRLHVAVADPGAAESTADEIRFITGREVSLYAALAEPLRAAIAAAYDLREQGGTIWHGASLDPSTEPGLSIVEPLGPPLIEDVEPILEEEDEPTPGTSSFLDLAPATTRPAGPAPLPELPSLDPLSLEPARARLAPVPSLLPLTRGPSSPPPGARPPAPLIAIEIGDGEALDDGEEEVLETVRVGPKRILVVDDEPDIVRLCQRALQTKGYVVETAADGAAAEAMLHKGEPYDLVLLDAMLPHVHGFEICQRLKATPKLRTTQVLMMSAVYRGWRFAQDARETYGADDYLEKPFHIADLLHRVDERLAQGKAPVPQKGEAERLYKEGIRLMEAKQVPEARALFEQVLKEDPFSPRGHFALARALAASGDGYRAITSYERAVELRPNLFPALKNLAQLYLEKGFRRKAAETLERALQSAPDPQTRESLRTSLLRLL